jgi:hypothetical protein
LDFWWGKENIDYFVGFYVRFRSDPDNANDAILCWGDVKGHVHAILFNSSLIALFERPSQQNDACNSL